VIRQALTQLGEELRQARIAAGLSQREVGAAVGISHTAISRIERGLALEVPFATLVVLASALGLDVPLRAYPRGDPIRDAAQVALIARVRARLPRQLGWRTEVPLGIAGDLRAWDAVINGPGWRLPIEAETRLRDVQALLRRLALKQRDGGAGVVLLVVADTRHNRHVLRAAADDFRASYPVQGRLVLAALTRGERPAGNGLLLA
jgi:transcriptional regulator with XRE-family HTH domain